MSLVRLQKLNAIKSLINDLVTDCMRDCEGNTSFKKDSPENNSRDLFEDNEQLKTDETEIPAGWMYVQEFRDKYPFLSVSTISDVLNEYDYYMIGNKKRISGRVYFNPKTYFEMFEKSIIKGRNSLNKYRAWKKQVETSIK